MKRGKILLACLLVSAMLAGCSAGLRSPLEPEAYLHLDAQGAEALLKEAGFSQIIPRPLEDLPPEGTGPENQVAWVELDGQKEFDRDTVFPKDAQAVIWFHCVPMCSLPEPGAGDHLQYAGLCRQAGFLHVQTEEVHDLDAGQQPGIRVTQEGKPVEPGQSLPVDGDLLVTGRYPKPAFQVILQIDFPGNLLLNKYDLELFVDDWLVDTLPHGTGRAYSVPLPEGSYVLTFSDPRDPEVRGTLPLEVREDLDLRCTLRCERGRVEVIQDALRTGPEPGQLRLPRSYRHYLRMDQARAEAELRELGFTDIRSAGAPEPYWEGDPENSIVRIAVGAQTEFEGGLKVPADTPVELIYYDADWQQAPETEQTEAPAEQTEAPTEQSAVRTVRLTWSAGIRSSGHVGQEWTHGLEVNGEALSSGCSLALEPGDRLSLRSWAQENDSLPDFGEHRDSVTVTEEMLSGGARLQWELYVYENSGRHSGSQAVWAYTLDMAAQDG